MLLFDISQGTKARFISHIIYSKLYDNKKIKFHLKPNNGVKLLEIMSEV